MKKTDVRKEVIELINLLDLRLISYKNQSLTELLALLRTLIKYARFDIEATRRELKGKH